MGKGMRGALVVSIVFFLATPGAKAATGLAVFFNPPYYPSACYQGNNGPMVAGVSDALWNHGRACGRRYRVTCISGANTAPHPCKPGRSVVVKVTDYCASGCNGVLNLSRDAFAHIADPSAGKVRVRYDPV